MRERPKNKHTIAVDIPTPGARGECAAFVVSVKNEAGIEIIFSSKIRSLNTPETRQQIAAEVDRLKALYPGAAFLES